jgi:DNA-binding NtrC family response regulator
VAHGTHDLQLVTLFPVPRVVVGVQAGPEAGSGQAEGERLRIGTAGDNDLVLSDESVSRYHLELSGTEAGIRVRDLGSTNGTRVGGLRVDSAVAPSGTTITIGRTQLLVHSSKRGVVELHDDVHFGRHLYGMTPVMRRLFRDLDKAADKDLPVLIQGESGTGKELVARTLHERGPRAEGPFVTVDCGAVTPNLVASELFGHERGAYTGADSRRIGAFERAHGGTLFLDEVGELGNELQASLLGVLERRRFQRLGGNEEIDVDVRVIAATHRDLHTEVNAGRFRLDLYYRLAVLRLEVPPLRERIEDIPLLVEHMLEEHGVEDRHAVFPDDRLDELMRHRWPGNVRELRNVVEVTVAMGRTPTLSPPRPKSSGLVIAVDEPYAEARSRVLQAFEERYLSHLLEQAKGNVSEAARRGKMNRSHLFTLLRRHGLR